MKKQKRPSLKDEVAETVYDKCRRVRGENDPMCQGLYAQHKAEMIDTEEYIDKVDDYTKRARGKRKKKRADSTISDDGEA